MNLKIPALVSPVVLVGFLALTHTAHADKVSIKGNSKTQVEGRCNEAGGVYFTPSKYGVYGCLNPDGSGIACGGTGKDAKTCDNWGPDKGAPATTKPSQDDFNKKAAVSRQIK
jgi:hypothetical protein